MPANNVADDPHYQQAAVYLKLAERHGWTPAQLNEIPPHLLRPLYETFFPAPPAETTATINRPLQRVVPLDPANPRLLSTLAQFWSGEVHLYMDAP